MDTWENWSQAYINFISKWQDKYINVSTYSYDKVLVSHYPLIQDSKL